MSRQIRLNAFTMNCVVHLAPGQWTAESDRSTGYLDTGHWVELAKLLERGRFDSLFLGDITGIYDVAGGSAEMALRTAAQVPMNDPAPLIPLMAHATEHLGFGVTLSVSYEHPYPLARRLTTLDHLSKGRVAWNIVTSYLDSGARSLGLDALVEHDARYDRADEFLDVCYALWEGGWEDGAVVRDREAGVYGDPARIHRVRHDGEHFRTDGVFQCEPSPQRTPLLFQAGGSDRGTRFAARHAECIFVGAPTPAGLRRTVDRLRDALRQAGRDPASVRIFAMFTVIVDETEALAKARHDAYRARVSYDGALALLSGWTGIDLSRYAPDDTLAYVDTNAGQSALASFSKLDPSRTWTVRDAVEFVGIGGRGGVAVGDPRQVADTLEAWMDETGVDGFNLASVEMPRTFEDIVAHLVPELQRRGVYKTEYADGTLREKLTGTDAQPASATLQAPHVGAAFRRHT
ncbi:LLM class flavin-dependent oxidoreductase [Cupriavidus plantarum]|uniref:LLM class flavin-dependent oxidoreductase n=1 Tax=Cupriavidus plantarum TaxID=942865 RepID=UPI001B0D30E9|nr:LLM class flavin-dependent oxidoreductase [Cupriavidus plantarum]CAG2137115.1 Dimethyl-sulfide monooxygenase [Cupriavidus plantarum]SMR84861.1 FMN-dependent oxidoreductase, nitrilotriacetate monooxygenase family [Cupriavidus plantarum]